MLRETPGIVSFYLGGARAHCYMPINRGYSTLRPIIINYVNYLGYIRAYLLVAHVSVVVAWWRAVVLVIDEMMGIMAHMAASPGTRSDRLRDPTPAQGTIVYSRPRRRKFLKVPQAAVSGREEAPWTM